MLQCCFKVFFYHLLIWRVHAANLVLQDTVERIYAGGLYADVPRGIFVVRGENVLLLGEVVSVRSQADRIMILNRLFRTSIVKMISRPP